VTFRLTIQYAIVRGLRVTLRRGVDQVWVGAYFKSPDHYGILKESPLPAALRLTFENLNTLLRDDDV
jgi:hypothetical protein